MSFHFRKAVENEGIIQTQSWPGMTAKTRSHEEDYARLSAVVKSRQTTNKQTKHPQKWDSRFANLIFDSYHLYHTLPTVLLKHTIVVSVVLIKVEEQR